MKMCVDWLVQFIPCVPITSAMSFLPLILPPQLENGPHAPVFQLLNLFAYGTYCDYKGTRWQQSLNKWGWPGNILLLQAVCLCCKRSPLSHRTVNLFPSDPVCRSFTDKLPGFFVFIQACGLLSVFVAVLAQWTIKETPVTACKNPKRLQQEVVC